MKTTSSMICTATTRLTHAECMVRLAALRPMARGERLAEHAPDPDVARRMAFPVLRLRLRCRLLMEALADVIGPPCDKQGRWCHTHHAKDCRADDARKLLGEP